ncbi:hypothetical protein BVY02_00810 [bacterium J17]|nr:hypothetical protein BVY02_00810 [bacterium J17]
MKNLSRLVSPLIFLLLTSACTATFSIRRADTTTFYKKITSNALTENKLSQLSQQQLRLLDLDKRYKEDVPGTIDALEQKLVELNQPMIALPIIETSYLYAKKLERKDETESAAYYLLTAAYANDYLRQDTGADLATRIDPVGPIVTRFYNSAVARLILLRQKKELSWDRELVFFTPNTRFYLTTERDNSNVFEPEYFDKYESSFEIESTGLVNEYVKPGIGASLVGIRSNKPKDENFLENRTIPAIYSPVNAIIYFEERNAWEPIEERSAKIHFYDLVRSEDIYLDDTLIPLQSDFSTPFAMLLAKVQPSTLKGFFDSFSSHKRLDLLELFMIDRYDPDKIPVIMVHGLFSNPATFIQMFNDLRGVEEIRKTYQFWFYRYPTGLPIAYSSGQLRREIEELRAKFDPEGDDLASKDMIVIGHSMGGLLTKMMVHKPKTSLWDELATVPPEELDLGDSEKEREKALARINEMFVYKPLPYISRVAFIATPHGGSSISTDFIGRLGSYLTTLPKFITKTATHVLTRNKDKIKFHPGQYTEARASTSIDQLAPDSPLLLKMQEIPIPITHHSIVGIRDAKTTERASDGIVPYDSAHLATATSEKLVQEGHSCLEHPETILEVKRILRLHRLERPKNRS